MRNDYRAVVLSAALLTGLSGFAVAGETASSSKFPAAAIGTHADANAPRAEVRKVPAQAQKPSPVAVSAPAPLCATLMCPGYALTGIGF